MAEPLARALVAAGSLYLALGTLFALAFVVWRVGRLDPQARGATVGFRVAIFPASAVLWPLLAWRWAGGLPPPDERNAHRRRARRPPGPEAGAGERAP